MDIDLGLGKKTRLEALKGRIIMVLGLVHYKRRVRTPDSQTQLCGRLALAQSKMEKLRLGQAGKPSIEVKLPIRSPSREAETKLAL